MEIENIEITRPNENVYRSHARAAVSKGQQVVEGRREKEPGADDSPRAKVPYFFSSACNARSAGALSSRRPLLARARQTWRPRARAPARLLIAFSI